MRSPVGKFRRSRRQSIDGLIGDKDRVTSSLGELLYAGSDVHGVTGPTAQITRVDGPGEVAFLNALSVTGP